MNTYVIGGLKWSVTVAKPRYTRNVNCVSKSLTGNIQLTRSTIGTKVAELCSGRRCKSCAAFQGKNPYMSTDLSGVPRGTPLLYSPLHPICPSCTLPMQSIDHSHCNKYPSRQGPKSRKNIFEFVNKRGIASHIAGQYCLDLQAANPNQTSINLPTVYKGGKRTRVSMSSLKKSKKMILTLDQMRRIYKAGETGLSILAFKDIMRILRNLGIRGAVSVKKIINEKKEMFGDIIESEILDVSRINSTIQMAICQDIPRLVKILYGGNSSLEYATMRPQRVKIGIDDGGDFVKYALSIIGLPSTLPPSSVLNTCIVAMHSKGETYSTIRKVLGIPPIESLTIDQGSNFQLQFIGDIKILN